MDENRREAELRQRIEELERKVNELTRSNEQLEQFASLIAHDLRNPLVTLSLNAGLLAQEYKGRLGQEADDIIQFIISNVNRISGMIGGLQNYSRLDCSPPSTQPCDCEAALASALADLPFVIEASGARVNHAPLPPVVADQDQMTELFRHLIDNALKFRRDVPPQIDISATTDERETTFVVKDNGIGIAPQHHERIFQIFRRLHPENSPYTGLGIGLAVCKKIVERHRGRIWVESTPGQGSTFYFTIPNPAVSPKKIGAKPLTIAVHSPER